MEKLDLRYPEVDKSDADALKKVREALVKEEQEEARSSKAKKASKS